MIKFYSKKEYQLIADIYRLGKISNLFQLHQGYGGSSKVTIETSLGKYVISKNILSDNKDIISKSKESLQHEIDLLNFIKGMPVPLFCFSSNGNYIEKFKGAWVTAYHFIPGKSPKIITPLMAYNLGSFLGKFHKRGRNFKKNLGSRRKFYDLNPGVMRKMNSLAAKQKNPILKSVVKEIRQGVEANCPPDSIPKGPIHVDIGHNNELFQGNKLLGIIDFGNFYIGPFMVDVGKTIMWNCCMDQKLNKKLFEKFILGYNSVRKLRKRESAYLKKSILYAIYSHIWVDLYHVPIKYVPESWPLFLIKNFLPVAKQVEKLDF